MAHRNIFGATFRVCGNYASFLGVTVARLDDGKLLIIHNADPLATDISKELGAHWVLKKLTRYVDLVEKNARVDELTHLHIGPLQAGCLYLAGDIPHLTFRRAAESNYVKWEERLSYNRPFIDVPFKICRRQLTLRISRRAAMSYFGFAATDAKGVSLLPAE